MTETTKKNYSIIETLVERYFGLDVSSFKRFKETLYNPFIDPAFGNLDEDLRSFIPFDTTNTELIDKGWGIFKEYFKIFVEENNITYTNFKNNLFRKGKSNLRLFKNLTEDLKAGFASSPKSKGVKNFYNNYYGERHYIPSGENEDAFLRRLNEVLNRIGTMKLPSNSNLNFVVSLNFADWFLCSSGESWKSCLSLDSDYDACYWSGLPGTIIDKNRGLFYITDGTKKNYRGIEADHILSRSWILLSRENVFNWLRFYPMEIINNHNVKILLSKTPFSEMKQISQNNDLYKSKYPLELLRYSSGITSFIFQDRTSFEKEKDEVYIIGVSNGFSGFNEEGEKIDWNMLECGQSLNNLISNNESISNYFEETNLCDSCGCRVGEDETIYHNETIYCYTCFNELFYCCGNCGETKSIEELSNEHSLCPDCYNKKYSHCTKCGDEVKKAKGKEDKEKWVCSSCAKKKKKKEEEVT